MKTGCFLEENGSIKYYLHDMLHRVDGPAVECVDGRKVWYQYGQLHRDGGPATEDVNGEKSWWQHGELHRVDGAAIEYANGNRDWYYQGIKIDCSSQQDFLKIIKLKAFW
jgi:hypothetical protein